MDEAMDSLHSTGGDITVTPLSTDTTEDQLVTQFMVSGCGCSKAQGKPCYQQFSQEHTASVRASCTQLSHAELDMAILGQLQACLNTSSAVSVQARHRETHNNRMERVYVRLHKAKQPLPQRGAPQVRNSNRAYVKVPV